MAKALVQARTEGRPCDVAEWLVVFRTRQSDGTWKHDYLLSNSVLTTSDAEFARVYTAQHRVEECLRRAKHEAGLAGYQVRTWEGWHHHQTLSLLATWFLTLETRRGKKAGAGIDGAAGAGGTGQDAGATVGWHGFGSHRADVAASLETQRRSAFLSLETTQPLATSAL
jgi:hypothetical protein